MAQVGSRVLRDDYPWNLQQLTEPHGSPANLPHVPHADTVEVRAKEEERHWQGGGMNRAVSDGDEDREVEQQVSTFTVAERAMDVAVAAVVDEILREQRFRVF